MTNSRSVFTEAIEDHLALKKQNMSIEPAMPLARYDVGDPLDRYPGGPSRGVDAGTVVVADDVESVFTDAAAAPSAFDPDATQMFTGPSPEQAMEAATALEPAFGDRPFEPLTGMTPMLSLVEDIDEDDADASDVVSAPVAGAAPMTLDGGDVLRFPGGVGPRDTVSGQEPLATSTFDAAPQPAGDSFDLDEAATGEQPVLVIDTEEPLNEFDAAPTASTPRDRTARPRFFGLGARKKAKEQQQADGWFTDGPRDFNWD